MTEEILLGSTESVCPACLSRIPAKHVEQDGKVYMLKTCPTHGSFRTLVWEGSPSMEQWKNEKDPSQGGNGMTEARKGCPFDCGLCPEHRQQTCCVLLEVTERCNLSCPVCFASSGSGPGNDPGLKEIENWYRILAENSRDYRIQLSGGEPTVRDDLPRIIALGRRYGFGFFQLNTNGIRLADKSYAASLKEAGLDCAFLQFDGTNDEIYKSIRGAALLEKKKEAIKNCGELGIGVVLVPTIVHGINDGNIGSILRFAMDGMPSIRGVHFQPISYFGRYPGDAPPQRITLPHMLRSIEEQTGGLMKTKHFLPPGGEHSRCSFHGNFIMNEEGNLIPISTAKTGCCSRPTDAAAGMRQARSFVIRQWAAPQRDQKTRPSPDSLDLFLKRASSFTFAVSGMLFQDAWNLDLERLKSCHIHVMSPEGKLIPFCAYNLTAQDGRSLYRRKTLHKETG